jgi:hypothetical protein
MSDQVLDVGAELGSNFEAVLEKIEQYDEISSEILEPTMQQSVEYTVPIAQGAAPLFSGRVRSLIGSRVVNKGGGKIYGVIGVQGKRSDKFWIRMVVAGRKPGAKQPSSLAMAPLTSGSDPEHEGYLVGRAIAEKGIAARPFIEETASRVMSWVVEQFKGAAERIMKALEVQEDGD